MLPRPIAPTSLPLRASRLVLAGAVLALCAACAAPDRAPKVDVLSTTPPDLPTATRVSQPTTGSLFRTSTYRPAFEDRRARLVGDVVTVQIAENVTASQKSTSTVDRSGEVSSNISAFPFLSASTLNRTALGAKSNNAFEGKGGTESANMFSGSITATVIEVLPNGHLVIAGEKQIGVNQNVDVLRFSGTVDPRALLPGSVVSSTQVANVRVASRGRGAQDEAQTIGWLSRFFLSFSPF